MTLHTLARLEDLPDPVPDATFVIVDVIISSTSIVRLLEAGAATVRPFADPEAALAFGDTTDDAVLVGEQGGQPVDGFDHSPLPSLIANREYDGRPVGILTSNGTRAIDRLGHDREVYVGTTVNAAAVADRLRASDRDVWLVAAGRQGDPVPEDTAGVQLIEHCYRGTLTDAVADDLATAIETSPTAEWLRGLGFEPDVEALLAFNSTETVPRLGRAGFVDAGES